MVFPKDNAAVQLDSHPQAHNAYVDIKAHYGAAGDGVTDDTVAIQAACDVIGAAGGGVVFFPPGTYLTTGIEILYPRISLRGAGRWTSILTSDTAATDTLLFTGEDNGSGIFICNNFEVADISITAGASARYAVNLGVGFLWNTMWHQVYIGTLSDTYAAVYGDFTDSSTSSCGDNLWTSCEFEVPGTSTATAAWDVTAYSAFNANSWIRCRWTMNHCDIPCFFMDNTNTGGYNYDNHFVGINAENANGGFIIALSAQDLNIDVAFYDFTTIAASMITLDSHAGGQRCMRTKLRVNRFGGTMPGGSYDIDLQDARQTNIMDSNTATGNGFSINWNYGSGFFVGSTAVVHTNGTNAVKVNTDYGTMQVSQVATADRGDAVGTGAGSMQYDTTVGPIFSDGSIWQEIRDFTPYDYPYVPGRIVTLASDVFTHANSSVTMGSAVVGGAWGVDVDEVFGISSNKGYLVSGETAYAPTYDVGFAYLDVGVENVTVQADVTVGTGNNIGIFARGDSTSAYHLMCTLKQGTGLQLRQDSGSLVDSASATVTAGVTYTLKMVVKGTEVKCYIDGTLYLTYFIANANYLHGTRVGLCTALDEDSTSRWDNFTCTGTPAQVTTGGYLSATKGLAVGNSASATTVAGHTVTNKIEVFSAAGVSLGYVAVYDALT